MTEASTKYRYPHTRVRRVVSSLLALALGAAVLAIVVQLFLIPFVGSLLCGTAFLTAVLILPLLLRTVLHPEIDVSETGLTLHPMIWPAQFVAWDGLADIVTHPLVYNDEAMGRVLHGKRYRPRQGAVIVMRREATVWPVYRLVGQLAGVGNVPAFAVSSTTHTDYGGLIGTLRRRVPSSKDGA